MECLSRRTQKLASLNKSCHNVIHRRTIKKKKIQSRVFPYAHRPSSKALQTLLGPAPLSISPEATEFLLRQIHLALITPWPKLNTFAERNSTRDKGNEASLIRRLNKEAKGTDIMPPSGLQSAPSCRTAHMRHTLFGSANSGGQSRHYGP